MRRISRIVAALVSIALLTMGPPAFASNPKPINLSITQSDNADPVTENALVSYALHVGNAGPQPANGITANLTLTAGRFVAGGGDRWVCVFNGLTGHCDQRGANPANDPSDLLSVVVQAPSSSTASQITHCATVGTSFTDYQDTDLSNNTACETTSIAEGTDLTLDQTDQPDPASAGNTVRYLVTVANNSNTVAASGLSLSNSISSGSITAIFGSGWTCTNTSPTATCDLAAPLAPNTAAPVIEMRVLTPSSSSPAVVTNTATISSTTGDSDPSNNTDTEQTQVAPSNGTASGYIAPEGGQVTTCSTDGATPQDPTCTTTAFPAGPGGLASLIEGNQLAICGGQCAGGSVDVIVPNGYTQGITGPIVINLVVDSTIITGPANDSTRVIYVQKSTEQGDIQAFVVPSCNARVQGLPCLRSQGRLPGGDYRAIVEMFSGDPIFDVGGGIVKVG